MKKSFKFNSMLFKYIARRCLVAIPTIWVIVTIIFFTIHFAPGDPITFIAGEGSMTEEYLALMRNRYGLDKPLITQYLIYLTKILHGDFGYSFRFRMPIFNLILERLPATLLLMLAATSIFITVGILLGAFAAKYQNSKFDLALIGFSVIGWSIPVFWLGQILLFIFALRLSWFSTHGMISVGLSTKGLSFILDVLKHAVLPVIALGLRFMALFARMMRTNTVETLAQDYITTAKSKGLTDNKILWNHAVPNAMLPVLTLIGMEFGTLFSGSVVTEVVFAWPGMGRLLYDGIYARDYPLVTGVILFISVTVIVSNLITDILYTLVDPRIKYD